LIDLELPDSDMPYAIESLLHPVPNKVSRRRQAHRRERWRLKQRRASSVMRYFTPKKLCATMKPEIIDLGVSIYIALIGRRWLLGSEKSGSWLEVNSYFTVRLSRGEKRSVTVHKETTRSDVDFSTRQT
jgi:hypothetical protein